MILEGPNLKNLRSNPIDLLTLDKICLICLLKVNFKYKTNIKRFWEGQRLKWLLLNVFDRWGTVFNFLLTITYWAGLVGSGLKLIFHLKAHSLIFAKSLLSSKKFRVTSWTTKKRDVSSAKNSTSHLTNRLYKSRT